MNCTQAGEALRGIGPQDELAAEVREHLESCPQCLQLSDEYARLDGDLAALYDSGFESGMFDETLAGLGEGPRRPRRFGRFLTAAAAALLLVAGGAWLAMGRKAKFEPYELTIADSTATAFKDVEGAQICARAKSRVTVLAPRQVQVLKGAVLFKIVPGRGKFTVAVPDGTIAVIGTEFSVKIEEDVTRVAVRSGKVRLENAGGTLALLPDLAGELKRKVKEPVPPATLAGVSVAGETLWRPWRWLDAAERAERLECLRGLLSTEDYDARVRSRKHLAEAGEEGIQAAIAWTAAPTPRVRLEAVLFLRGAPAGHAGARTALEKVAGNGREQAGIREQARMSMDELKAKFREETPAQ